MPAAERNGQDSENYIPFSRNPALLWNIEDKIVWKAWHKVNYMTSGFFLYFPIRKQRRTASLTFTVWRAVLLYI